MAVCAGSSSTILRESRSYRLWSSGPTNPTTKQEKAAPSRQIITAELCGNEVALHELLSGWVICLHMLVYATHDFNHTFGSSAQIADKPCNYIPDLVRVYMNEV